VIHVIISKDFMPEALARLDDIVKKVFSPAARVHTSSRPTQIINDFRLRRLALRVVLGDKKEEKEEKGEERGGVEILYIYTASEYDLIPFNELLSKGGKKIKIGNPFVLARFVLIELWILNIVKSQGNIDHNFAEFRTNKLIAVVLALREKLSKASHKSIQEKYLHPGPMQIFQNLPSSYIGVYESDDLALKHQVNKISGQKFGDYYPQQWLKRNGEYRTFSESKK
jgi:hypothetical protein